MVHLVVLYVVPMAFCERNPVPLVFCCRYDEFVATPECAASATTNCGCFFYPSAHNDTPCELGHYHQHEGQVPYLECMQYYRGNTSKGVLRADGLDDRALVNVVTEIEPIDFVSGVDDEAFLVDQFEDLLERSVAANRPFLAVICFHGAHIPFVFSLFQVVHPLSNYAYA